MTSLGAKYIAISVTASQNQGLAAIDSKMSSLLRNAVILDIICFVGCALQSTDFA